MKAIIVEDEQTGRDNLLLKLNQNCPGVDVVATCSSGEEAIEKISALQPQLVFLDINLGSMSGFDVLDRLQHVDFEVIITTAYDNFAIRAIRNSALDFLLKPFTEDELKTAVNKAWKSMVKHSGVKQIAVPYDSGLRILQCDDIQWVEADNNNTIFYLNKDTDKQLRVPRKFSEIYNKLPRNLFFQVHRGHIVNRNYIAEYTREGYAKLTTGSSISVSKTYRDEFLLWLNV